MLQMPRKYAYLGAGLLLMGTLAGAIYAATVARNVTPTVAQEVPPTPLPPERPTPAPQPTMTAEENQEIIRKFLEEHKDQITKLGPERAGTITHIAGKDIQLPPDAYEWGVIGGWHCYPNWPCPKGLILVIKRGKSTIWVSIHSGEIAYESLEPGEEGAFDFLKEALKQ